MSARWTDETLHEGVRMGFEVRRTLHAADTGQQRLELVENPVFGTMMLLDGAVQVTSADEFAYHEMMAHVPLAAHGGVRRVLIIGGGDCGLAEEVLKHRDLERVVQVEIDPDVVAFARDHFPELNAAAFADPRFEIKIGDGAKFVAETQDHFDLILVDSTDPAGPGAVLFTETFYRDCAGRLAPNGIIVTQSGVPFLQGDAFVAGLGALHRATGDASCYLTVVPTYFGGHMALGWAGPGAAAARHTAETVLAERMAGIATRYWSPAMHHAAFALPPFIAEALAAARRG
ncbi:polyamine aminopropyltransferase [Arsenicitalea aurantiaca]|uniref:Polyamine aminopropyltransferase n=1 Tax=Arsenicitalea aurantiaca TaxID=1783274 RepID=A0A433X7P8_9HYPH|nr:polyamine aminopropyltransferase [Arsenicitalea aurantiaca]RUT30094.1 polyamine aminopropyltransferase [Arsenicitalea aurantiaca]